jgi:hypothetical protein
VGEGGGVGDATTPPPPPPPPHSIFCAAKPRVYPAREGKDSEKQTRYKAIHTITHEKDGDQAATSKFPLPYTYMEGVKTRRRSR